MAYVPSEYWEARYRRHGALTVGRAGMTARQVAAQMEAFWSHLLPRVPRPCARLLDMGCGCGRMFPHVLRDLPGTVYWGVDICGEAIALANRAAGRRPAQCNHALCWEQPADWPSGPNYLLLEDDRIPFPDGFFDCVVACTVFQHLVSDESFSLWTKEIARVTRPGGTVVVLDGCGCKAAHARSRTPEEVGEALGMAKTVEVNGDGRILRTALVTESEFVDAESKGSHWCASFEKGARDDPRRPPWACSGAPPSRGGRFDPAPFLLHPRGRGPRGGEGG
jgi:SAM-dependent methyltransferase